MKTHLRLLKSEGRTFVNVAKKVSANVKTESKQFFTGDICSLFSHGYVAMAVRSPRRLKGTHMAVEFVFLLHYRPWRMWTQRVL